jgi:hypothetical protein
MFSVVASVNALDAFVMNLYSARVVGFPAATKFTYQFDCGDGKGYDAPQTALFIQCATRVAGTRTVRGKVIDQDGDAASYSGTVTVKLRPDTVSVTSTAPVSPIAGTTYTVSATSRSGRAVVISTSPSATCTSNGNIVTFVNFGLCTIAADIPADSTWAAAPRVSQKPRVIWNFSGFFTPVRNDPYLNVMTAGRYLLIPFSVGGSKPGNFATASTQSYTCPNTSLRNNILAPTTATPGLRYDSTTDRYTLTMATDRLWSGTCRVVTITLVDGTRHSLHFLFN